MRSIHPRLKLTLSLICASHLFQASVGNGDQGEQNCGTIGAQCTFNISCEDMAKAGWGSAYWILEALSNFQSNLNFAHNALQDAAINDTLAINSLVSDFSTPSDYQVASGIKAYISASLFIAGGAAGSSALISSELAGARASFLGPAEADLRTAQAGEDQAAIEAAQAQVNAIKADIAKFGTAQRVSSVSGALICKWLVVCLNGKGTESLSMATTDYRLTRSCGPHIRPERQCQCQRSGSNRYR